MSCTLSLADDCILNEQLLFISSPVPAWEKAGVRVSLNAVLLKPVGDKGLAPEPAVAVWKCWGLNSRLFNQYSLLYPLRRCITFHQLTF